jgi:hypothetical protein
MTSRYFTKRTRSREKPSAAIIHSEEEGEETKTDPSSFFTLLRSTPS